MPSRTLTKLRIVSAALGAAIGDREKELQNGWRTVMCFDADVILGGLFLFQNLLDMTERQESQSSGAPERLLYDHHLVRFGESSMSDMPGATRGADHHHYLFDRSDQRRRL